MSNLSIQVPIVSNPDNTEDPKIAASLTNISNWANAGVGTDNLEPTIITDLGLALSAFTTPSFTNSWVGAGAGYAIMSALNLVVFRGSMSGGSNESSAFTLPAQYRPSQIKRFAVANIAPGPIAEAGYIEVDSTGTVTPFVTSSNAVELSAIMFFAGT